MAAAPNTAAPAADSRRLPALDWMRGLVMVLMVIDHAGDMWDADKNLTDTWWLWVPGSTLDTAQWFSRWITHLCAPTFVFLAGTSLALSLERRLAAGANASAADRHIAVRGLFIASLDLLWVSVWWCLHGSLNGPLLQVLYAIGLSMVAMVLLRRLPTRLLLAVGLALVIGSELFVDFGNIFDRGGMFWLQAALVNTGLWGFPSLSAPDWGFYIFYPLLPWLGIMIVGWVFGRWLLQHGNRGSAAPERLLLGCGLGALLLFVAVRYPTSGYGDMQLFRADDSLIQWLHVNKYPPSVTFAALELGIMALLLSLFFFVQRRKWARGRGIAQAGPLLVFGQTALFFYLVHIPVLALPQMLVGERHGIGARYASTLLTLIVLYPACLWYRSVKQRKAASLLRFL